MTNIEFLQKYNIVLLGNASDILITEVVCEYFTNIDKQKLVSFTSVISALDNAFLKHYPKYDTKYREYLNVFISSPRNMKKPQINVDKLKGFYDFVTLNNLEEYAFSVDSTVLKTVSPELYSLKVLLDK